MLTTYLKKPLTLEQYRVGPAGSHLDQFTDWLEVRGYQPDRVLHLLRGVHRFSCWADNAGLPVQALDREALEAFRHHLHSMQRLYYPSGNYGHLFMGARHFVTFLAATGPVTSPALVPPASSAPQLLVEFRHWMLTHRGTTAATLTNYRLTLIDLLKTLGDQPARDDTRALREFILNRARRHGIGHAKTVVTSVRMFLRFLIATGRCAPGVDHAIPTIARWRLASWPKYLLAEVVERSIASCDLTIPIGIRDRAVLLLLARLGLRAGDVIALQLRDLDWRAGTVQVSGKSRRQHRLPLPQDVGDAILHYLAYRPDMDNDPVFLTTSAPFKGLSYQAVGKIVTQAMHRAGVQTPVHGSHVLRYSAATQMLRHGVPLAAIGAVLRFARFMHAEDRRHEIPPAGVFCGRRQQPTPYIFREEEVQRLVTSARRLGPPGSLRPYTYSTLFGLLAATGMRPSKARALQLGDLTPDGLIIRETKFKKSRLLPLHDTTWVALEGSLDRRRRVAGHAPHLFVSRWGGPLSYSVMVDTFDDVVKAAGMPSEAGKARPRLMDLRHTFAVRGLETCPESRDQVGHHMLALTTYLGHAKVENTYWYLESTPELMADIARCCEAFVYGGEP